MKINTVPMLTRNSFIAIATLFLFTLACAPKKQVIETASAIKVTDEEKLANQLTQSVLWYQSSLERKAICVMAYKNAEALLKQNMQKYGQSKKQLAVILDLDETVLDNSPYEGFLIKNNLSYNSESWTKWVNQSSAALIPGVRSFLIRAEESGIEIFYISNRNEKLLEPTLRNLQKFELPVVDPDHILLKVETSDKSERRSMIAANYKIILTIGDQFADFESDGYSKYYEQSLEQSNFELPDTVLNHFVLLPNPMYGEFEKNLIPNTKDATAESKLMNRDRAIKAMR